VVWGRGDPSRVVELASHAEAVGFDSVWVGDSIVARPRFEPLLLLAAVSAVTERVALGTAVYLPLLRHPTVSAHAFATLHGLAGSGRLIVGVGAGASIPATDDELAAVGMPAGRRVSRIVETVEQWRAAWSDRSAPVWLAGSGPRMLRLAGARFDGWLPYPPTPDAYRDSYRHVVDAAVAAGRDPSACTPAAYLTVSIGDGAEDATAELDRYMSGYYGLPLEVMSQVQGCHSGTAESAAEWIGEYGAAGAEHVVIRIGHTDLDTQAAAASKLIGALR
jgi:alkanesulfonate monooxygenase SsuD/methylene tetrahydromethanopterin reductase-like flavin-dependent oxidoreductase (luciferase family)